MLGSHSDSQTPPRPTNESERAPEEHPIAVLPKPSLEPVASPLPDLRRVLVCLDGRPWRMVALNVGAFFTLGDLWSGNRDITVAGDLSWLDWTHIVILAGCVQTIWIRLARIMRSLRQAGAEE